MPDPFVLSTDQLGDSTKSKVAKPLDGANASNTLQTSNFTRRTLFVFVSSMFLAGFTHPAPSSTLAPIYWMVKKILILPLVNDSPQTTIIITAQELGSIAKKIVDEELSSSLTKYDPEVVSIGDARRADPNNLMVMVMLSVRKDSYNGENIGALYIDLKRTGDKIGLEYYAFPEPVTINNNSDPAQSVALPLREILRKVVTNPLFARHSSR
jgi:hypothetical protein